MIWDLLDKMTKLSKYFYLNTITVYITEALYYSDVISLEYVYVLYVRTYTFRFVKKAGTPMNKSHTVTVN